MILYDMTLTDVCRLGYSRDVFEVYRPGFNININCHANTYFVLPIDFHYTK
jgi:hypothetical protein